MLLDSTLHPPCSTDQEVFEVTVPTNRKELALTDRLALRVGLWLMLRAERRRRLARLQADPAELARVLHMRARIAREAQRRAVYDMQRHML